MLRLIIAPEAEQDMIDIWYYIAKDNIVNADRFIEKMQKKLNWLTEFSDVGTNRDELIAGLRSIPYHRYMLYYRVNDKTLELVRALHSARDVDQIFS
jgi:plasmid stabilization system protein ParE